MLSRKRIKPTINQVKVIELEKRENNKVWAKLECGHSRLLDGNTLNSSYLKCLECKLPNKTEPKFLPISTKIEWML